MENTDISEGDRSYFNETSEFVDAYLYVFDGSVAGYCFVNKRFLDVPELGTKTPLPPASFYIFKCYVLHEFRGRGIFTASLSHINSQMLPQGYATSFICASAGNIASLRGIRLAGYLTLCSCWMIEKGNFKRRLHPFEGQLLESMHAFGTPA